MRPRAPAFLALLVAFAAAGSPRPGEDPGASPAPSLVPGSRLSTTGSVLSRLIEHFASDPVVSVHLQPKDFAVIQAPDGIHVFYTRHDVAITGMLGEPLGTEYTEKNFGHAVSTDLMNWTWQSLPRDTTVLQVDTLSNRWDNWHVWAPSIVQRKRDLTWFMFYTGVKRAGSAGPANQSIGFATSSDLVNWTRASAPVLTAASVPWAKPRSSVYGSSEQLRDPFVMEFPPGSGRYLMYFVAVADSATSEMAVGVARSRNLTKWIADSTYLPNTRDLVVESPHVFADSSRWWLFFTTDNQRVRFQTNALDRSPADSVADDWTPSTWSVALYNYLDGTPAEVAHWHGSEHLRLPQQEYLSAYDDSLASIDFGGMVWYRPDPSQAWRFSLGAAPTAGTGPPPRRAAASAAVALVVTRLEPGIPGVTLRVDLPVAAAVSLRVHDAMGRQCRTLLRGSLPAGSTPVSWDGRDEQGAIVPSGVYFLRLEAHGVERAAKVPLFR